MKAAYIEKPGPPENIVYGNLPKPKPADNQVLVKVKAVAVNPVDTYIRAGMYSMDLPQPFVIGCDLAGVVEAVGPAVTKFHKGDRVWGSNQGLLGRQGTFAEYAAVDECWLYPTPDEVSDQDAAAAALVGITAHLGLFRDAQLKMGEKVFVNGGTGGVGSCVVQMARAVGAACLPRPAATRRCGVCQQLGANMAVNYKTDDLDAALGKFGAVDVWFETLREQDLGPGGQTPGVSRADHRDGGARIAAAAARRAVLREGRQAVRLRHVQRPARGAAEVRGRDQSLAGQGKAAAADRPRDAAYRSGRRASPPGRKHARQGRHAGRQDRADRVRRGARLFGPLSPWERARARAADEPTVFPIICYPLASPPCSGSASCPW